MNEYYNRAEDLLNKYSDVVDYLEKNNMFDKFNEIVYNHACEMDGAEIPSPESYLKALAEHLEFESKALYFSYNN